MLEQQAWMKLAPEMTHAWRQMMEEGKEASALEADCREAAEHAAQAGSEERAAALFAKMEHAPMRAGYPYEEPSDWEDIQKLVSGTEKTDWRTALSEEELKEKLSGAWIGRISGCLLGKPLEGLRTPIIREILSSTGNAPIHRYVDSREFSRELMEKVDASSWKKDSWIELIGDAAPIDDDTNYTVLALKLIEEYGPAFCPNDVLEAWLAWMPMFAACTAERIAYRNAAMGLYAPETATRNNPFREWIGAQIRGDFFGYINPGDPKTAASMAWRDGSVSHIKNGIYGEMWVSAMLAEAAVSGDITDIIKTGLREIPPRSRLTEGVEKVLEQYRRGIPAEQVFGDIHKDYDEFDGFDWCHTISNARIVAASLLYGEKDFTRTIGMAVEAGFDTDCNGATAGSVLGMALGRKGIPSYWPDGFCGRLKTSISGYHLVTLEQLTEKTFALMK